MPKLKNTYYIWDIFGDFQTLCPFPLLLDKSCSRQIFQIDKNLTRAKRGFQKYIGTKNLFCIRCIFCIFTRKTMHKWRRMCKYFVIYEKAKAEDRFFKFASKVRRGAGKIGSDVLTLIKLIDHDLIWRDEKLHSSIIQDKKSVLERSESRKKLERLLTFSQNFFHYELFKWHLFKKKCTVS